MLYLYGKDEKDRINDRLDSSIIKIVALPGGHHFDGKFDLIAAEITKYLPALSPR